MVKKKTLLDRIEKLERENQFLASKNDALTSALGNKEKIIEAYLRAGIDLSIMSNVTLRGIQFSAFLHYFRGNQLENAKNVLDVFFKGADSSKTTFYEYKDRRQKGMIFWLERSDILGAELIGGLIVEKHKKKELADVPCLVHKMFEEDIAEGTEGGESSEWPMMPRMQRVGDYILMDEVIGTDFSEFVPLLMSKPETRAKNLLLNILLDKQMRYNAFIRSRKIDINPSLIVVPEHEKKILEVIEAASRLEEITLKKEGKESLAAKFKSLDARARFSVRDGTPANYRIIKEAADYLLSGRFLQEDGRKCSRIYKEADEILRKGIFSYDHDNMMMKTFQSDEAILGLEDYYPALPLSLRKMHELRFVRHIKKFGEDVNYYWDYAVEEKVFRHLRKCLVFMTDPNYHDPEGIMIKHHLRMAKESLLGRELSEGEKKNITFNEVFNLMVNTNYRA